jgi:hypothetical protein
MNTEVFPLSRRAGEVIHTTNSFIPQYGILPQGFGASVELAVLILLFLQDTGKSSFAFGAQIHSVFGGLGPLAVDTDIWWICEYARPDYVAVCAALGVSARHGIV